MCEKCSRDRIRLYKGVGREDGYWCSWGGWKMCMRGSGTEGGLGCGGWEVGGCGRVLPLRVVLAIDDVGMLLCRACVWAPAF